MPTGMPHLNAFTLFTPVIDGNLARTTVGYSRNPYLGTECLKFKHWTAGGLGYDLGRSSRPSSVLTAHPGGDATSASLGIGAAYFLRPGTAYTSMGEPQHRLPRS